MRAVELSARVSKDHTVHLRLPEEIGEGPAEVIVLVPPDAEGSKRPSGPTLDDILDGPRVDARLIRSKEKIDADLRAERESWE